MKRCGVVGFTFLLFIVFCCIIVPHFLQAWSLSPRGTKYEQHIAKEHSGWWQRTVEGLALQGAEHFSGPVHEEITNRIFGCEESKKLCGDPEVEFAGPFVLAGVRWNDDPPFQLKRGEAQHTSCKIDQTIRFTTQPRCWYQLFKDAKRRAASGEVPNLSNRASLLARSHFGDLQFFHAMASQDGEAAGETQEHIMMWAEFSWKVGTGEYGLQTNLADVDIEGFKNFFGSSGWTVQDLFTVGNPALRFHITELAFGSILHTVEDSFAKGHVEREQSPASTNCTRVPQFPAPPRIIEFHSYAHQDEHKHGGNDKRNAFDEEAQNDKSNVVLVGRPLVDFYQQKAKWETVKPYFECMFSVVDTHTLATPGDEFKAE